MTRQLQRKMSLRVEQIQNSSLPFWYVYIHIYPQPFASFHALERLSIGEGGAFPSVPRDSRVFNSFAAGFHFFFDGSAAGAEKSRSMGFCSSAFPAASSTEISALQGV